MSQKKPTKYYSSRQERVVANYLGWSVVSGSGARAFNPGDIRSDEFLGECKTFTEKSDVIYCYNSVWEKIRNEAKSVMKRPILFVDNGTQEDKHTWCVVPLEYIAFVGNAILVEDAPFKTSKTRVSFSHCDMVSHFATYLRSSGCKIVGAKFILNGDNVVLVSLSTMKSIIDGGFD